MLGTFFRVHRGGAAIASLDGIGALGVALAFGFVLLALAYALGPVPGCVVSPAFTLAVFLRWRITAREDVVDWSAPVPGALLGGAVGARWPRTSCHFAALRYSQGRFREQRVGNRSS